MSLTPLENPLKRLLTIPTVMNWRGGFDPTEQYFLNDVAVSPLTTASYILTGRTALLGGADPSLNPDWIELSNPTTGVASVSAGTGINLTGTGTNPIINNSGVLTTTAGLGISITGTANPIITNDGIRTITAGSGISVSAGNNPSIGNTGILSITAGTGLASTGGQNPTLSISAPQSSLLTNFTSSVNIGGLNPPTQIVAGATGTVVMILSSPTLFSTQLASGAPDTNGTWLFDFNSWTFELASPPATPIGLNRNLAISFVDNLTVGGPYTYTPANGGRIYFISGTTTPFTITLGEIAFDVNLARATGMRTVDGVVIFNNTNVDMTEAGYGDVMGSYYPLGVQ